MKHVQSNPDLDCRENIENFVDLFYASLLADKLLAPIFVDVAAIDLDVHLPHIKNYWCKLLLGEREYQRHTMNIHRQLHAKRPLREDDFRRWLDTFLTVLRRHYEGPRSDRAAEIAASIAANMAKALVD
ncbi:MAG: group III truncated hemoglobin [Halioglobus sp.]